MSKRRSLWSSLIGVTVVLGSLFLAVGHDIRSKHSSGNVSANEQLPQSRGPVQNIRFILYDTGIYPHQLRVRAGIVGITIEDRTRASAGLLIERVNGGLRVPVGQVIRPVNQIRARSQMTLEAGTYRITTGNLSSEAELIVSQ